ncbi:MAG TPA: UbiA family prenyltransferase [Burkholderiales bacterium]|nr:UbiA family prenyltransferase [Burkholderiales bacterium]
MKLRTAFRLGRVSNLPTVWSNTLAGAVLAGAGGFGAQFAVMLLAFSLFYTGGMFLNDAFDARFDAAQRPERPIPSGEVSRRAVFAWGYSMMALGTGLLAPFGVAPALAGVALAAAITFYDWHHKGNVFGPVVMGLCRVLVYVAAGLCITLALPDALWIGAALMWCYLIGLTYVAKQENLGRVENLWPLAFLAAPVAYGAWLALGQPALWPFWLLFSGWMLVALWFLRRRAKGDIPRAVVSLIAGISLLDALLIAGTGALALAACALAAFGVTLILQRHIAGT